MNLKAVWNTGSDFVFTGIVVIVLVGSGHLINLPVYISNELAALIANRTALKYVQDLENKLKNNNISIKSSTTSKKTIKNDIE